MKICPKLSKEKIRSQTWNWRNLSGCCRVGQK